MKFFEGIFSFDTNRGSVRLENEDQAKVCVNASHSVMLLVCDGMGGQNKGDYASRYACSILSEAFMKRKGKPFFTQFWLARTIRKINKSIFAQAEKSEIYKGMGTTLVCVIVEGRQMTIANIGDSRAYAFSAGILERLTEDQTVVDYLRRTGKISDDEASGHADRHILLNALGVFPSVSVDVKRKTYYGQSIFCCSDGLYNNVSEAEIRAVLSSNDRPDVKVASLIAEGNANGGSDNMAIAYWEVSK